MRPLFPIRRDLTTARGQKIFVRMIATWRRIVGPQVISKAAMAPVTPGRFDRFLAPALERIMLVRGNALIAIGLDVLAHLGILVISAAFVAGGSSVTSPRHKWRSFLASRPRVPASSPCLAQRAPQADPERVSFGAGIANTIAVDFSAFGSV